ncbi:chemotaxis protein CheW [Ideonella sp. DXS29W]|uniref:Chemotaxis protein CheW n=1 Tax=Ideonella lacteola TaxID=2984193 RepID=A0ABU9BUS8_9BURK
MEALDVSIDSDADGAGAASQQLLRFALGDDAYGAPIDRIREILEVPPTTEMPRMPSFVLGVMNLRGAVVPVIDLGARFGLAATRIGRRSCVIVVDSSTEPTNGSARQPLGLLVDAVHEVLDIDAGALAPAPSLGTRIAPEFIAAVTRARDQLLTIIDLDRALNSDDLAQLISAEAAHA